MQTISVGDLQNINLYFTRVHFLWRRYTLAGSFFATFKKRLTQGKIYSTIDGARTEIFNYIEMLYNLVKRHSHTGGVFPVKFDEDYFSRLESV
ncbi:MAG: putative transposase [Pseudohongiellaceae bacterium]|jgi:putative transposase